MISEEILETLAGVQEDLPEDSSAHTMAELASEVLRLRKGIRAIADSPHLMWEEHEALTDLLNGVTQ